MPKCKKCKKHFPNRVLIDGKTRIIHTRVYCLDCSPFGKHNTKDLTQPERNQGDKIQCFKCKEWFDKGQFYLKRGKLHTWCKLCFKKDVIQRKQLRKKQAVEYKGGKCEKCEYNKCIWALEFHHKHKSDKEFNLSTLMRYSFEKIKKELDKCNLICANCHRETEFIKIFGFGNAKKLK